VKKKLETCFDLGLVALAAWFCTRPIGWDHKEARCEMYLAGRLVASDPVTSGKIAEMRYEGIRYDGPYGTWALPGGDYVWKTNVLW